MVGREKPKALCTEKMLLKRPPSTLASLVPDMVPNRSKTIEILWQHRLSAHKEVVKKLHFQQYYEVAALINHTRGDVITTENTTSGIMITYSK